MDDPDAYFSHFAQIDDDGRLFISGVINDWKPVHERGITVVIDLEGDIDHGVPTAADQFLYVYLPIHDGNLPQLDRLHAVSDMVASLMSKGHSVLSHCGMGLNRSALVESGAGAAGHECEGCGCPAARAAAGGAV